MSFLSLISDYMEFFFIVLFSTIFLFIIYSKNMSGIVMNLHFIFSKMHKLGIPILPTILNKVLIRLLFNCQIGLGTEFGKNVNLGYGGLGIVIHNNSIIGDNVNIGSNVTIGGTNKQPKVPIIGASSIISTGAKIIGPVNIGRECVIGANAVVIKDMPDNSLAVGIPAKIIKKDIDISNYRD
tara:strand:- start:485 stop:1030 length:546 start_codon:yes stop_codon:yes gene_type:complete